MHTINNNIFSYWQLIEDPQGVNGFVEEDIDEDLRLNGRDIQRSSKIKKQLKRAQRKTIQKVVQHAAIVIRDAPSHHVPKTIAFEELIYIYCAKPEEMKEKHKKGGPLIVGGHAIMANLSEPQLQQIISRHPSSILE